MIMMPRGKIKSFLGILLIIIFFIITSYIAQNYLDFLEVYMENNVFGMVLYVLILIGSAVVAPIDVVFLMPVATGLWGWFGAALLSLAGWTLGSAVVFFLSRKYGKPLIKRFVPLAKIYKYEHLMPETNIFIGIVFLRLAVPVDIVSYAVGLFTSIRFWPYFFATLIGFAPLAFFLAFLGTLPTSVQILGFITFILVVILGLLSAKYRQKIKLERQGKIK